MSTLFVVDDDRSFRDSVCALFRAARIPCECFASGEEFLASSAPEQGGCLVLDVRMPGIDGYDVARELRRRKSALPIVLVSGHETILSDSLALTGNIREFLQKPFDPEDLLAAVKDLMAEDGETNR